MFSELIIYILHQLLLLITLLLSHCRCFIRFDIIRRVLQNIFNMDVQFVMGVTDIDDKIINKAKEVSMYMYNPEMY